MLVVAAHAAPASAAMVSFGGGGLQITGDPGESSRLTVRSTHRDGATVHDDAHGLRAGVGCLGTPRDLTCTLLPIADCYPCAATIDLGDGDDTLDLAGIGVKGGLRVDAGPGDDVIHILGDTYASVRGGAGDDALRADKGSDLDGGEGADLLQGDLASATYAARTAAVFVTLDGVANDGAPGEGDNVATGSVIGGEGADALTGNDAANELRGGSGDDALAGGDGADTLYADSGDDRVEGGAGDDRITATSPGAAVLCGSGADVALGLAVPGWYGDCETVFETLTEEPYLTVSDVTVRQRRPGVTLGWHRYPGVVDAPVSASGVVEMRYRATVIARGRFSGVARPAGLAVTLELTSRGRALACRSARTVRLLVVATGQTTFATPRSAIRRVARLPRVGTCARRPATQR